MKHALAIVNRGEGVQRDIKYVYGGKKRKYQFGVFDPFTKKYHFSIFFTKESKNAMIAFKRAEKYFGFKALSIQTDNGAEFRGFFHAWLQKKKLSHYFIPKKSPWRNDNVERVHRTVDDEFYNNLYGKWKTAYG
jgi:IS30 family transposase